MCTCTVYMLSVHVYFHFSNVDVHVFYVFLKAIFGNKHVARCHS